MDIIYTQNANLPLGVGHRRMCCVAHLDGWHSAWLTKDRGVLPYLFSRDYGFDSFLVGIRHPGEDYEGQLRYIPGVKLAFLPDASQETWLRFMEKNAATFDLLFLNGADMPYLPLVDTYKRLNPAGKVYLATDMNSGWLDRIPWQRNDFQRFLGQCDVVGASCRAMQRRISQKWPCSPAYIPNGFFDYGVKREHVDFSSKENIILTVGRIGTWQKDNETLVKAFAQVAASLPQWRLQMIGPAEEKFHQWLKKFLAENESLSGRIEMVGPVYDRAKLYACYGWAKIFALTSIFEGGNPNVTSEALAGGCAIVCSDIDAVQDIIADGGCGEHFKIGDVQALAGILQSLCRDEERLARYSRRALAWSKENFDYPHIARRLHYLLFEENRGD